MLQVKGPVLEDKTNAAGSSQNQSDEALPEKRYRTRSSAPITEPEEKKKPPKSKPFIEYKGKIEYATEMNDIAFMSDGLL